MKQVWYKIFVSEISVGRKDVFVLLIILVGPVRKHRFICWQANKLIGSLFKNITFIYLNNTKISEVHFKDLSHSITKIVTQNQCSTIYAAFSTKLYRVEDGFQIYKIHNQSVYFKIVYKTDNLIV